jgi:hypothetical protein
MDTVIKLILLIVGVSIPLFVIILTIIALYKAFKKPQNILPPVTSKFKRPNFDMLMRNISFQKEMAIKKGKRKKWQVIGLLISITITCLVLLYLSYSRKFNGEFWDKIIAELFVVAISSFDFYSIVEWNGNSEKVNKLTFREDELRIWDESHPESPCVDFSSSQIKDTIDKLL